MGRLETAIAAFEAAAKIKPDDPSIHFNLANAFDEMGRWEDAENEFLRAHELEPHDSGTLINLGTVQRKLGRLDTAIENFEAAVSLNDGSALARGNLGHAYFELGDNDKASACFTDAIALAPTIVEYQFGLVDALLSAGDFGATETACQKIIDTDADNAKAFNQLGKIFQRAGPARRIGREVRARRGACSGRSRDAHRPWCRSARTRADN